jgi:hypothetical protein
MGGKGKVADNTSLGKLADVIPKLMEENKDLRKALDEMRRALETEREKRHELELRVQKVEGWKVSHEERERELYWKTVDLTARNMRNNVIIQGPGWGQRAPDQAWERWETTEALVRKLLAELGLDGEVAIERAHRLGGHRVGRQRPVVVMFTRWPDKAKFMDLRGEARKLNVWINDQLPQEILEKRRRLRVAAEAQFGPLGNGQNGTTKVIHNYDKIKVAGRTYDLRVDEAGDALVALGHPGGGGSGRGDMHNQRGRDEANSQRQPGHNLKRHAPTGGDPPSPNSAGGGGKRAMVDSASGGGDTAALPGATPGGVDPLSQFLH